VGEPDPSTEREEAAQNARRLTELLQEIRVATAGVQILFGFLLAVPFQVGFEKVTSFERHVYLVVLVSSAMSAVLLISPTPMHRLLFGRGQKREIIRYANSVVIGGLVLLAFAMIGAVLLVTHVIFGRAAAIAITIPTAVAFAWVWFLVPLMRRGRQL
jgi:hypothetical protein